MWVGDGADSLANDALSSGLDDGAASVIGVWGVDGGFGNGEGLCACSWGVLPTSAARLGDCLLAASGVSGRGVALLLAMRCIVRFVSMVA